MSLRRNPTFGVLIFYSVVVSGALLLVLTRGPRSPGLTPAESAAEMARLAALAHHTRVETPDGDGPVHVTWSPAADGYRGLALLPQWRLDVADAGPEAHLAVRLDVEDGTRLRNPGRPPLAAAALYRVPAASDLVAPDAPRRLVVRVAPVAGGGEAAVVTVDNVAGPAGAAAGTAVGWAWAEWVPGAWPGPEAGELRTLATLARLVRARICADPEEWSSCRATSLTLGRGARPEVLRIDLAPLGEDAGAVPFELELATEDGVLATGVLRPLPGATLQLPADLYVRPPRSRQEVATPADPGLVVVSYRPGDPAWAGKRWAIDFRTLLQGAKW